MLKPVDFSSPEIYKQIQGVKKPEDKVDVYKMQFEKLRIMLLFYTEQDFKQVKFHKLNSDQILKFLGWPGFVRNKKLTGKVIEALKFI